MQSEQPQQRRKFYGRLKGKSLSAKQQSRIDELLPQICINGVETGRVDLQSHFNNQNPNWLEIGFGGGEHLAHIGSAHPEKNIVGCEAYINGVAMALRHIEVNQLSNIRIHAADARDLMDALPDHTFERIYLLYPDPWPKARHEKRRFMHPDNLNVLRRLVRQGAELRLASDIPEYITHSLERVEESSGWNELARDRKTPWEGWIRTRFEAKAIQAGRTPQYCIFKAV